MDQHANKTEYYKVQSIDINRTLICVNIAVAIYLQFNEDFRNLKEISASVSVWKVTQST